MTDSEFYTEVKSAQEAYNQSYKKGCQKMNNTLKNERQAHLALSITPEQRNQERVADARARIENALAKERRNDKFWHRVKISLFQLVCIAIIAYTLIHFA